MNRVLYSNLGQVMRVVILSPEKMEISYPWFLGFFWNKKFGVWFLSMDSSLGPCVLVAILFNSVFYSAWMWHFVYWNLRVFSRVLVKLLGWFLDKGVSISFWSLHFAFRFIQRRYCWFLLVWNHHQLQLAHYH